MKIRSVRTSGLMLALAAVASLAGCTQYVKQTDYDAAISQLQDKDQQLQQQIDGIKTDMEQRFEKGEIRDAGKLNRRVALVVDFSGSGS